MADQAPPENSQSSAPAFPAKIRVHALAKMLGLTSKQVLAKVAEFGSELRSAQSSVDKALAERVHAALAAPSVSRPGAEKTGRSAPHASGAFRTTGAHDTHNEKALSPQPPRPQRWTAPTSGRWKA